MTISILDCTLRDGGYYTNWDFDNAVVERYIHSIEKLPIEYIEIGYCNLPSAEYLGKYAYCPKFLIEKFTHLTSKKLAIMVNEKNLPANKAEQLLSTYIGTFKLVRVAIDPQNIERALPLLQTIKAMGFEVAANIMYMSKWDEYADFYQKLQSLNKYVDVLYMVDSFGSVFGEDLRKIVAKVQENTTCKIGFHGHNNLEMALENTITAIDCGVDFVDSTILGMGRGAGNLKTELLLTYLNKKKDVAVDFNVLGEVVSTFSELHNKYKWGTNLPYMISGMNSYSQKEVMDLVQNRLYSFEQIVKILDHRKHSVSANTLPTLPLTHFDNILIIGGGKNALNHIDGIKEFVKKNKNIALIHATAKNAIPYRDIPIPQYYCVTGNEERRINNVVGNKEFNGMCVYAPSPRQMETKVPDFAIGKAFELASFDFTDNYKNSCTTIALQLAQNLCAAGNIYIVGYDGYDNEMISEKEMSLSSENLTLFKSFKSFYSKQLISLTPTSYKELHIQSIYSLL